MQTCSGSAYTQSLKCAVLDLYHRYRGFFQGSLPKTVDPFLTVPNLSTLHMPKTIANTIAHIVPSWGD